MRKMILNEQTKAYMLRMYGLYEQGKLVPREEQQLFQDLLDSGLAWQMGQEVADLTRRLLAVGLIESNLEFSQKGKWS